MIISSEEFKRMFPEFKETSDDEIERNLDAIEHLIRKRCNNNFQNRNIRFTAPSIDGVLNTMNQKVLPFVKSGDTLQISDSRFNDGLYTVKEIKNQTIVLNKTLLPSINLVTKIEYPSDVVHGALNMCCYVLRMKNVSNNLIDKVGISSESLSRHSVSYDTNHMNKWISGDLSGYPDELLAFMKPYRKARF